jgi:hypothetical protein
MNSATMWTITNYEHGNQLVPPMIPMPYGNRCWSDGVYSQGSSNRLKPSESCLGGEDHRKVASLVCPCESEPQAREQGEQRKLTYFGIQTVLAPLPSAPSYSSRRRAKLSPRQVLISFSRRDTHKTATTH